MKRIICFLVSIKNFLLYGKFIRHIYVDEYEQQVAIIADDYNFRCSDNYQRKNGELVYKNAYLIRSKCKYCGKEDISWCSEDMYNRYIKEK